MENEDYRWNGIMQIIRWVGSILWNVNAKKGHKKQPESLFKLPGDKKQKIEPATNREVLRAVKKSKLLKQWG